MFELQVKKNKRITLEKLIEFLTEKNKYLEKKIFLEHDTEYWITDNDLYITLLILNKKKDIIFKITKILEFVTIIPSKSINEIKKPLSYEELKHYIQKYNINKTLK